MKPLPLPRLRTHTHPISDLKMAGVLRGEINPEDPALPLPPADWQNMPLEERLILVDYVTVKWAQQRASVGGKKWRGSGENGKFSGFTVAPRTLLFLSSRRLPDIGCCLHCSMNTQASNARSAPAPNGCRSAVLCPARRF